LVRGYSFRPRGWTLVLAVAACAAFIALGNWQSGRAEDKRRLAEELASSKERPAVVVDASPMRLDAVLHRRVAARGGFAAARTVFLDNRSRGGRPGYEVVTPLLLSPSVGVLVERGWVARAQRDAVRTPPGVVRVEGIAFDHLPRALSPAGAPQTGATRQNLDIADYAREIGLALQPIVIRQENDLRDGLSRDWPAPDFGRDRNRAYALQWYSFAALAAVFGLVFSFRRAA
jgi:surfeit locus 1 family protein